MPHNTSPAYPAQATMALLCICAEFPPAGGAVDDADPLTWFEPGRIIFIETLVERGMTLRQLFEVPLANALMCVRDRGLSLLHVDHLALFDDAARSVDVLFSPWMDQLTPAVCDALGLTAARLLRDGLTKRHVRRMSLPYSEWARLFGLDGEAVDALGIVDYPAFFRDAGRDATFLPDIRL